MVIVPGVLDDHDGATVEPTGLPYTEAELKTMLQGGRESKHPRTELPPSEKKRRRARNKRARASRKKNRG